MKCLNLCSHMCTIVLQYEPDRHPEVGVKSAQRVLEILQMYAGSRRPATLTEIAKALHLPKSSCLALLQTLEENGYLYQSGEGGRYYPTGRWLSNAQAIASHDPVVMHIRPTLESLRERTDETLLLAKRFETNALYLDVVESKQILRYTAEIGQMKSLHCSASGQALLGGMESEDRNAVIDRLKLDRVSASTITTRSALRRKVETGVECGWYFVVGEYHADTAAVAVPLQLNGDPYAVVLAAPRHRLENSIERAGKLLLAACRPLSDAKSTAHRQ